MKRLVSIALVFALLTGIGILSPSGVNALTVNETVLKYGSIGDTVLKLQTRLKDLLFYSGPLSGEYAEKTREAVKAVQAAYGLTETGEADSKLQDIIFGECYRPLAYGISGKDVVRLQERLKELGYYFDKVSGNYYNDTTTSVTEFQKDNGLAETGKADVSTQKLIYSEQYVRKTIVPTSSASPTPSPQPTSTPNTAFSGILEYGSTGDRVKYMQERLKLLGFFDGKVSGGYYARTKTAVTLFQSYNNLKKDGVVREDTWKAIWSQDAVDKASTPMPTSVPTPVPYSIDVDVRNQVITIWGLSDSGDYSVPVQKFICSTGTTGYPSDLGLWTLTGRKALWATFPTWGGGMAKYWVRINESIAFHSVLYNTVDNMDLNVKSFKKLGKRASHGCIRLTVAGAKWIYYNCGEGVKVRIHDDAAYDPELTYSLKPGPLNPNNMLPYVTPTPTPAPVYDGTKIPDQTIRSLAIGSVGEDVYWLQSKLRELGFYMGTVTGQYREGTRDAVKKFQKANKIYPDGKAGKQTLTVLFTMVQYGILTPTPSLFVTPSPPGNAGHIVPAL
jgi:peptidoglycan hydrolase-like protein with peptidoglycan-binding domain